MSKNQKQDKNDLAYDKVIESFSHRVNALLSELEEHTDPFDLRYGELNPAEEECFRKVQRQISKAKRSLHQGIMNLDLAQVLSRGIDLHLCPSPKVPTGINGDELRKAGHR